MLFWYWYVRIGIRWLSNEGSHRSVVHLHDGPVWLDSFDIYIEKVTLEYDGGWESVSDKESSELRSRSALNNKEDGPNDVNSLETWVADVRRVIEFTNFVSHDLRYFTNPYKNGAGSGLKDDKPTFRWSYGPIDTKDEALLSLLLILNF